MTDDAIEVVDGADAESLEEILHHTSEQTLRIAHVDEGIGELKRSLEDLSEATQAGIVELRNAVAAVSQAPSAAPQQASGEDALYRQAVIERLEDLERRLRGQGRLAGLLVTLAVGQLGALGAVTWLGRERPSVPQADSAALVVPTTQVPPAPLVPPAPADEVRADDDRQDLRAKKKKKR